MKPLLVMARIVFVGCLWSIIFTEGVRVIMLENWRFDMFWPLHWVYAWNLWSAGWVIDTPKEWAFVLIILSFIPLWLTGWIALSLVAWEKIAYKIITFPIRLIKGNTVSIKPSMNRAPVVVKKKSYKEIRPVGHRVPIRDYSETSNKASDTSVANKSVVSSYPTSNTALNPLKQRAVSTRETFSHSLFNLDDEDEDFDLDFDAFEKADIFKIDENKSKKKTETRNIKSRRDFDEDDIYEDKMSEDDDYSVSNRKSSQNMRRKDDKKFENRKPQTDKENVREKRENRREFEDSRTNRNDRRKDLNTNTDKQVRGNNPIVDVLTQKGYDVISGITIKNTIIDFLGVAEGKICLCLVDKEMGDWLADEERFNNEEPLWFSENSHRISPVRKVSLAKDALLRKLEDADFDIEVKPYVIIQMGNIINAEDMFETWDDTGVEVTRINRGSPKEIKLFSKTVEEADGKLDFDDFGKLKKLLKSSS